MPVQQPQARAANEIGNAHEQVQEERPVSAESKAQGDTDMKDAYKDMSGALRKPARNISKPGQYN